MKIRNHAKAILRASCTRFSSLLARAATAKTTSELAMGGKGRRCSRAVGRRLVGGWEKDKKEEFIPFQPKEITAIYLGCRMKDTDQAAIKKLAVEKYKHASVFAANKSATRFALEFSQV